MLWHYFFTFLLSVACTETLEMSVIHIAVMRHFCQHNQKCYTYFDVNSCITEHC